MSSAQHFNGIPKKRINHPPLPLSLAWKPLSFLSFSFLLFFLFSFFFSKLVGRFPRLLDEHAAFTHVAARWQITSSRIRNRESAAIILPSLFPNLLSLSLFDESTRSIEDTRIHYDSSIGCQTIISIRSFPIIWQKSSSLPFFYPFASQRKQSLRSENISPEPIRVNFPEKSNRKETTDRALDLDDPPLGDCGGMGAGETRQTSATCGRKRAPSVTMFLSPPRWQNVVTDRGLSNG